MIAYHITREHSETTFNLIFPSIYLAPYQTHKPSILIATRIDRSMFFQTSSVESLFWQRVTNLIKSAFNFVLFLFILYFAHPRAYKTRGSSIYEEIMALQLWHSVAYAHDQRISIYRSNRHTLAVFHIFSKGIIQIPTLEIHEIENNLFLC